MGIPKLSEHSHILIFVLIRLSVYDVTLYCIVVGVNFTMVSVVFAHVRDILSHSYSTHKRLLNAFGACGRVRVGRGIP